MNGFIIINKIGEGSFSSVLKVKRKIDGNIYALKRVKFAKLNDKEKSNALNEIRILASINNKNVISYKEAFFDEKDSSLNIVMEYADQGDLFKKITEYKKQNKHFTEEEIWITFIQLLKGLKSLHDLNILHRDIKSANVFLFNDGFVKLGDLNVSKITKKGLGYTQTGTPYYASPEVWKDKPYDYKSDIWSLGCVIYEMCTLNPPFRAENMENLYKKVIRGFYPEISNKYSNDLSEIIKLMIQIEVGARPSCEELLKMPIIIKKMELLNKNEIIENDNLNEDNNNKVLLRTIRVSQNINSLSRNLPKPNYIFDKNLNSFRDNGISLNNNQMFFNMKDPNQMYNIVNNNIILKNINILKINDGVASPHYRKKNLFNEKNKNNLKRNISFSPNQIKYKLQNPYINKNFIQQNSKLILPELKAKNNVYQNRNLSKVKSLNPIKSNKIKILNRCPSNNNYNIMKNEEKNANNENISYNLENLSNINSINKKNLNIKIQKNMNIKNAILRIQSPEYNYRNRNMKRNLINDIDYSFNYGNLNRYHDNNSILNNKSIKMLKNSSNNNLKNCQRMMINVNV